VRAQAHDQLIYPARGGDLALCITIDDWRALNTAVENAIAGHQPE